MIYAKPEAENAIIGWLNIGEDKGQLLSAFPEMTAEWFATERGRAIFTAANAIIKGGGVVNGLTLREQLDDTGKLEQAGENDTFALMTHSWNVTESAGQSLGEAYRRRKVAEILTIAEREGLKAGEAMALLKPLADTEKPDKLFEAFSKASIPSTKLKDIGIKKRHSIIGHWFKEADLGFVFAPRGLGKTWFSLSLAAAITGKVTFGPWKVHDHAPVLYVDGEMPCESIEQRINGMGADETFHVLSHESLDHLTGKVLNLTDQEAQDALTRLCLRDGIKLLVLDNLSCLFSGMAEDKADAWELVLPWLLALRRHGIAVVIVAHSGRDSKKMRGTSKREDAAFWIIRLDEAQDDIDLRDGARFISRFTKQRNSPTEEPALEWSFQTDSEGKVNISTKEAEGMAVLIQWVRDGVTSATDIADAMGLSKSQVSKMATRAIEAGRLRKDGREYAVA
jgi:hypothetical protein